MQNDDKQVGKEKNGPKIRKCWHRMIPWIALFCVFMIKLSGFSTRVQSVIQELKDRHERGLYPYGPELYLSNLPSSIEEFQLLRLVQDRIGFRKVRRCKIVYDSHGHSRCYGFLTFYDLEGCISAIRALQNKQVKGKILRLVPSKNPPRARTENTNQIVVRNIRGENSPTHADNQSPPRPLKNSTGSWMHMDQEDASITIMKRCCFTNSSLYRASGS